MFRRAIWDKLPGSIFENFEIARVTRGSFNRGQLQISERAITK